MPFRRDIWEDKSPEKTADQGSLKDPGIYLIALRAHLSRGRKMLGDIVESVADALPRPRLFPARTHSDKDSDFR